MAVYTDGIHLLADTEEELHALAGAIGLERKRFNDYRHKYYNLIGDKVEMAIKAGARFKDTRELIMLNKPTSE